MDCLGLAVEWEQNPEIRARLREKGFFLELPVGEDICKPTRTNATSNAMVILPLLERLKSNGRLPHLEPLKLEVASLFQKCGVSSLGEKAVYKASVEVKQLVGFVKRRCSRREVTKERAQGLKLHVQSDIETVFYYNNSRMVYSIMWFSRGIWPATVCVAC